MAAATQATSLEVGTRAWSQLVAVFQLPSPVPLLLVKVSVHAGYEVGAVLLGVFVVDVFVVDECGAGDDSPLDRVVAAWGRIICGPGAVFVVVATVGAGDGADADPVAEEGDWVGGRGMGAVAARKALVSGGTTSVEDGLLPAALAAVGATPSPKAIVAAAATTAVPLRIAPIFVPFASGPALGTEIVHQLAAH